jgi:HK97 family phage major capsid protein
VNRATLRGAVRDAFGRMERACAAWEDDPSSPAAERAFNSAEREHAEAVKKLERAEGLAEARAALPVAPNEPGDRPLGDETDLSRAAPGVVKRAWDPATQRIGGEESTYHLGGKFSFMKDQRFAQKGDKDAIERILRSAREMADAGRPMKDADGNVMDERAIAETAGSGGELVAPLYLQDEYLALARAARPYFDLLTKRPLPPNSNSINIPRLKTGTKTAAQKDLGAVASTDITTGLLTFPVITVAGQQDFARQLFDRAVPELADMVVFPDLVADYLTKTDIQALTGTGVAPNAKGVTETVEAGQKVTFTSGTPKVKEFYSKVADAIQRIHTKRFLPPSAIVMHPRRWAWLLASVDSNERPLFLPAANNPFNATGVQEGVQSQGLVGQMQGLPVTVDPSIPINLGAGTNQDLVIVQRVQDAWVLEDEPIKTRVYEEVLSNELAVRAQVFNYLALTHERYAEGISTIEGTGLVAPTF